jgi:hypothetical protein
MAKKKAGKKMNHTDQAFDVSKVEAKLKNIKSLSDLTGSNGIIQ